MRSKIFNPRNIFVFTAIALAAGSRLIPQEYRFYNFAPVGALCLFGGACFSNRFLAYFIPFAALLISDALIGPYGWGMVPVYVAYALIITGGTLVGKKITPLNVLIGSVASSVVFFLLTNFAFFYSESLYPHNWEGIIASYTAGLKFFRYTLESDLFFSLVLFGSFYLAQLRFPRLSKI